jgi:hypothetical protein
MGTDSQSNQFVVDLRGATSRITFAFLDNGLYIMSYDAIHASLERCRLAAADNRIDHASLIEAIEQLVVMLETDLTQIKVALGHTATLLDRHQS